MSLARTALVLVLASLLAGAARAVDAEAEPAGDEQAFRRVPVSVTTISGESLFVDQGRDAGILEGDRVQLFPFGGPARLGRVLSVARTSARVRMRDGVGEVQVGTEGFVLVPAGRLGATEVEEDEAAAASGEGDGEEPAREVPEHPPWEHAPLNWDAEVPLLAPVTALEPEERGGELSGRWHTNAEYTRDGGATDQDFVTTLSGLDLLWENPFGRGGDLVLDMDYFYRRALVAEGSDDTESELVLNRASYGQDAIRGRSTYWRAGRFLQSEFPEFGVLDGVEVGQRLPSGSRVGASVGFLPEPDDELTSGQDVQAAVYYRYVSDPGETLRLGTGYQKTWHRGAADRDLVVGTAAYRPLARLFLNGSAWVDYYTSGDRIKDPGFELTQLQLSGTYGGTTGGAGIFASYFRFPELDRNEFSTVVAGQIANDRVARVGVNAWRNLSRSYRLSSRVGVWEDEDDSGGNADLDLTLHEVLYERGDVRLGVFGNDGDLASGLGARVSASRRFAAGFANLAYDVTSLEQANATSGNGDSLRHAVRASWDMSLGGGWDFTLFAYGFSAEDQDSVTAGCTLQRRF